MSLSVIQVRIYLSLKVHNFILENFSFFVFCSLGIFFDVDMLMLLLGSIEANKQLLIIQWISAIKSTHILHIFDSPNGHDDNKLSM